MNYRYKMELSYDGKRYKGWQRLGADQKGDTVQGKIESTLSRILEKEVEIEGAGRTDAGVHALGQVATFSSPKRLDTKTVMEALNFYLPEDIAVLSLSSVYAGFHARYSATSKTYVYRILNTEIPDPFKRLYALYLSEPLLVEKMISASEGFLGEHDFSAFTTAKSKKKSMVRRISRLEIVTKPCPSGEEIEVRITAEGFLHNMARKITGTLIEIGLERVPESRVLQMLESGDRTLSSEMAPAHGLYLASVDYEIEKKKGRKAGLKMEDIDD